MILLSLKQNQKQFSDNTSSKGISLWTPSFLFCNDLWMMQRSNIACRLLHGCEIGERSPLGELQQIQSGHPLIRHTPTDSCTFNHSLIHYITEGSIRWQWKSPFTLNGLDTIREMSSKTIVLPILAIQKGIVWWIVWDIFRGVEGGIGIGSRRTQSKSRGNGQIEINCTILHNL